MIFGMTVTSGGGVGWRGAALLLATVVGLGGCENILDVENPNNLVEEELGNATSARSIVNGASGTVARGIGAMLGPYSVASDEITWVGSRDAWRELDQGFVDNPRNEFTDDAFRFMAQGRWMADQAVERLEGFDQANELQDRSQLARAYLFAALAYITIGDMFEDFAFSDMREPSPPVGPANMIQATYGKAIDYLDKGLTVAQATNNTALQTNILGTRARAKFSREVRTKLTPAGQTPADPLVNDAGANADAAAALALSQDFRFVLTLANDDLAYAGEASLAYVVNQRREVAPHPVYGTITTTAATANLEDPITGEADPILQATLSEFQAAYVNQPITIASAREMRLILAEAALAQGNTTEFASRINAIRSAAGLPDWTGQVPALEMLKHTRRVVFFAQGRRLADMYRFGEQSPVWQTNPPAVAVSRPGTFLPITCVEVRAHPEDFPGITC